MPNSELSTIFKHTLFPYQELKDFAHDLKIYINNSIVEKNLYNVDIAGFTMQMYQWILNYYILLQLKKQNPNIKTIIGGIITQNQAFEYMRAFKEADFAIWGEGKISVSKLLKYQDDPSKFEEIPNLLFRKDGVTLFNFYFDIKFVHINNIN